MIRPATDLDVPVIQRIARVTWADVYNGMIPADIQETALREWYSTEGLGQSIRSAGSRFLVADSDGELLGFAQFVLQSAGVAQLARIYVLPDRQNRGIGTQLLRRGIEGVQTVRVRVERDNTIGRGFYERNGFRKVSEGVVDLFGYEVPVVNYETRSSG